MCAVYMFQWTVLRDIKSSVQDLPSLPNFHKHFIKFQAGNEIDFPKVLDQNITFNASSDTRRTKNKIS